LKKHRAKGKELSVKKQGKTTPSPFILVDSLKQPDLRFLEIDFFPLGPGKK
jgi:hypothetical protein